MTNEEAIRVLGNLSLYHDDDNEIVEALGKAIEALKNKRPSLLLTQMEKIEPINRFVHVTINDPKYGEVDGWLDKSRQLLFTDSVSTEFAKRSYGWTWKEDKE